MTGRSKLVLKVCLPTPDREPIDFEDDSGARWSYLPRDLVVSGTTLGSTWQVKVPGR